MKSPTNKDMFSESGCQSRDSLLRYIQGNLSAGEKHSVEEHLVDCPLCSDALDGLKHNPTTHVMEDINASLHEMVKSGGPSVTGKYLLAAASMAAVVILSYFAFKQFSEVRDEKFAVHEPNFEDVNPIKKHENPLTAETLSVTTPFPKYVAPIANSENFEKPSANDELTITDDGQSEAEYSSEEQTASATSLKSLPQIADVELNNKIAETGVFHTAPATANNITYIDNLKVIEYPDPVTDEAKDLQTNKHTPSAYQNREKKREAAVEEKLQGISTKRNSNYQEMVTDPLILYNKGRYESAIRGFDRLLEINPNDYNALFYKGMSLYHLKKYNIAINHFKKIGDDSNNPFSEEALFYMAKSYAGNGDTFNAVSNFNRVVYTNGFYSEKAADELNKLK